MTVWLFMSAVEVSASTEAHPQPRSTDFSNVALYTLQIEKERVPTAIVRESVVHLHSTVLNLTHMNPLIRV